MKYSELPTKARVANTFFISPINNKLLLGKTGIAVVGDDEFMMTLQDLETAVREKIPVKIVVVNDNSYRAHLSGFVCSLQS